MHKHTQTKAITCSTGVIYNDLHVKSAYTLRTPTSACVGHLEPDACSMSMICQLLMARAQVQYSLPCASLRCMQHNVGHETVGFDCMRVQGMCVCVCVSVCVWLQVTTSL